MRVAAYQAPLLAAGSMDALGLIRTRVEWCEAEGVTILCCPEAILGGLADYAGDHTEFAIAADAHRSKKGEACMVTNSRIWRSCVCAGVSPGRAACWCERMRSL